MVAGKVADGRGGSVTGVRLGLKQNDHGDNTWSVRFAFKLNGVRHAALQRIIVTFDCCNIQ
jgi:hypothetical protein